MTAMRLQRLYFCLQFSYVSIELYHLYSQVLVCMILIYLPLLLKLCPQSIINLFVYHIARFFFIKVQQFLRLAL